MRWCSVRHVSMWGWSHEDSGAHTPDGMAEAAKSELMFSMPSAYLICNSPSSSQGAESELPAYIVILYKAVRLADSDSSHSS